MPHNTRVAVATTPTVTGGEVRSRVRPPTADAPKRELYAVAVEVLHKGSGEWRPDIRYTHAVDPQAAKYEVLRCIDWRRESCRVVGVSRVIGYKVMDKQGLILAV
jgi:hypothetical protein